MGGFATDIKLGPIGREIVLLGTDNIDNLASWSVQAGNAQAETLNVNDEASTTLHRRHRRIWTLGAEEISEDLMWAFESLNSRRDQELAFIFADDWKVNSENYLTTGLTTVSLKTNPMLRLHKLYKAAGLTDIVTIVGVWDAADMKGAQVDPPDTEYFVGTGSLDPDTFELTLDSSPGPIGTEVHINWTYKGALVKVVDPGVTAEWTGFFHPTTGLPTYTLGMVLRGI